jgi:hypothetical protein
MALPTVKKLVSNTDAQFAKRYGRRKLSDNKVDDKKRAVWKAMFREEVFKALSVVNNDLIARIRGGA